MTRSNRARRLAAVVLGAGLLAALSPAARAADPVQINAILSLTGAYAFVGTSEVNALKALEGYANKTGGIGGRPVSFVITDDQSNPQISLQLAQGLIAKRVPVIFGPGNAASCSAVTPLVHDGPVVYCFVNSGDPVPGGYIFETLFSTDAMLNVVVRYFREHGWNRIATITSTDAGGQDAERAFLLAAAKPENKSIQIVAREHFAAADLSVAALMTRIKAANPDALLAWSTGTGAGTIFRGAQEVGVNLPTATSPGNLNAAFFKQYATLLPSDLLFAGVPYYAGDALSDRATKSAIATMNDALAAIGQPVDHVTISAWDPALLVIDALRKLGPDTSPEKLRAYLAGVRGWVGANGPYDFRADPQRGLGESNIIMVRWDAQRNAPVVVSKFGGAPLPGK
jgi:branched-chain amino acid transport system substrate-binding protein